LTAGIVATRPARTQRGARTAPPCALVVFGATGDLTRRKLVPALYRLRAAGSIGDSFAVVGVARRELTEDAFRDAQVEALEAHGGTDGNGRADFARTLHYVRGEFEDPDTYARLKERLDGLDRDAGLEGNRLFYLATPPSEFEPIIRRLSEAGLIASPDAERWTRVIVEKPFGHDLDSARELNALVNRAFDERQVFRIDHYLGKETVQNILVFRFANSIFEPLWNRNHVRYVEICATETEGVGTRGAFYEETGVIRDIVQNHLLEVLCLTAMEPPISGDAEDIRGEKLKVLQALRPATEDGVERNVALGQYRGYREEPRVSRDSKTATYAAMRVFVDNWRWQGVPFYLRSGKKLAKRITEVSLHMRRIPLCLFGRDVCREIEPNVLTLRIQPDEGIMLRFASKVPGHDLTVGSVTMDMKYLEAFGGDPPEAYERLLLDAMRGDPTLFARRDAVEASWTWITPILEHFETHPPADFPNYEPGSWGPECGAQLLARDSRGWRSL